MRRAVQKLPEHERRVIELRFGLDGDPQSVEELRTFRSRHRLAALGRPLVPEAGVHPNDPREERGS